MANKTQHTAGLFDVRNVIGLLFVLYGIILVLSAFVLDPGVDAASNAKNAGYNLWTGIPMLIAGVVFVVWAKLAPQKVDEKAVKKAEEAREELLN